VAAVGIGAGQGFGSVSMLVPANASLVGQTFFGRWYVRDSNAPGGVAATPLSGSQYSATRAELRPTKSIRPTRSWSSTIGTSFNREPDTAGLNFWMNQISQCGANANCIEAMRVNTLGVVLPVD
jgi:hypothetical protein